MNYINQVLYRNLKSGNEFHNLIPKYQGIKKSFEKGNQLSDTHDTLKYMAQWSEKYSYQFKEVAKKLLRSSEIETVGANYNFLHDHFQYNIDEDIQNLYSPSAAWHFRRTGFDCKTYSILASCLLIEQGISHSFRMVEQNGIAPGQFSHVYVVVHAKNKDYVIDATKHQNTEVSYIKKHDYKMRNLKHVGLAAPFQRPLGLGTLPVGLGCSCQGVPLRSNGLGSPVVMTNTLNNLSNWLLSLEQNGLSRQTAQAFYNEVKNAFNSNIDPYISSVIEVLNRNPKTKGLNGLFDSAITMGTNAISNFDYQGAAISAGTSILTSIIPKNLVGNLVNSTVGAVFANGFDVSCWGSSYNEQKAKEDISKDLPFAMQWSGFDKNINTQTYQKLQEFIYGYAADAAHGTNPNFASCTRKGHKLRHDAILKLHHDTEAYLRTKFQLKELGRMSGRVSIPTGIPYSGGRDWSWDYNDLMKFELIPLQPQVLSQNPNGQIAVVNADGTPALQPQVLSQNPNGQIAVVNADGTPAKATTGTKPPTPNSSSSNLLPIVLGVGALAFLLFSPVMKTQPKK